MRQKIVVLKEENKMKQRIKRILSVALVLCLAANAFCMISETAQAAAYTKTIKKTVKLRENERKMLRFNLKSSADVTVTAKLAGSSKSDKYQYVGVLYKGDGGVVRAIEVRGGQHNSQKIKYKKGTQRLEIFASGQGTLKFTIEIKAKKPVLQFKSLKAAAATDTMAGGPSADDER